MIEILGPMLAATSAAVLVSISSRGERGRLESLLKEERARVSQLMTLIQAREAPQEFAAYLNDDFKPEPIPEGRIWDDTGLFYVDTDGDDD